MTDQDRVLFQKFIKQWYQRYGRHTLPWRQTTDAYSIMISEIMLQQTQVERVIPKYQAFLERFPTIDTLAQAALSEVLRYWQGLGYNRRGQNLQKAAQVVRDRYGSRLPETRAELEQLPGLGPYTASAILTFAYNQPCVVIETNIRAVFIYHFFYGEETVTDKQLIPLIAAALETSNPREWYSALMDYGSYLKKLVPNPTRKSRHYIKQASFSGSNRQMRGKIIKLLTQVPSITAEQLYHSLNSDQSLVDKALRQLINEKLVEYIPTPDPKLIGVKLKE